MALFTDGPIASLDDLRRYDSAVLDTASAEGIDIEAKLEVAQRETSLEITSFLLRNGLHLGTSRNLHKVLVTEPVLHANCIHALELIYRDAFNSQLNSRYEGKWKEYTRLSKHALQLLFDIGIGITHSPISRAFPPSCSYVPGESSEDRNYTVSVAWQGADGLCGQTSPSVSIAVPAGSLLSVHTAPMPPEATGWFVYAAVAGEAAVRQNESALARNAVWTENSNGLRFDLASIPEQGPTTYVVGRSTMQRG